MWTLNRTLKTPAPVSALSFNSSSGTGSLFCGSDDGSLRMYDADSWKVLRAVKGLGAEVSSVLPAETDSADVWVACGHRALLFSLASSDDGPLILTPSNAKKTIELTDSEDILNELSLHANNKMLAFCADSGTVGTFEIPPGKVEKMKSGHESICGNVKFIPDRPRELVSGGYDTALLHFDFVERKIIGRRDITNQLSNEGMSMSPPFIQSCAMSESGVLAAGTADGRLWIGFGGEKIVEPASGSSGKKKRSRKWEGFKDEMEVLEKVAEGPVVGIVWRESTRLIISTLLGTLICFSIDRTTTPPKIEEVSRQDTKGVAKVNALSACGATQLALGGISKDGKGVVEIWNVSFD